MWEQEYREDNVSQEPHNQDMDQGKWRRRRRGGLLGFSSARASRRATGLTPWSITRHQDAKYIKAQDPPTVYNRAIQQKYNPFDCKQV